ncbi:MAG: UDP-glucose/GDP-mannose dehydrogenase family protein [Pirellulaceae bacterium]|nr:UDP-glucose/GDP-mannose dehydrogenase family protein [Pirellulaceae bacterium]
MKLAMIGTGYVGLVTGTCLSESGNEVTCVDIDLAKIERLRQGDIPIYEPGLSELVVRNAAQGRLLFTADCKAAVTDARLVFIAVGTPQDEKGAADLKYVMGAVAAIAPHLRDDAVVVIKSTVPVGTNVKVASRLQELAAKSTDVASNPEFLKEGAAIDDFQRPDRVVIGVRTENAKRLLSQLYRPFLRTSNPLLSMTPESAELTKYVANAMLAAKISFINEMANLCERKGGDINDVRQGIGHDQRIGFQFLFPGVGYGGSCFPKDIRALAQMEREVGMDPRMLDAIDEINTAQKQTLIEKIEKHFGGPPKGKTIAVWGLAFKPRTDDIREAPALVLIDYLLKSGARVQAHDPEAMPNVKKEYAARKDLGNLDQRVLFADQPLDCLKGADALAINTEWSVFRNPDFDQMKKLLKAPLIFDGRNLYSAETMREFGFTYYSIGRAAVKP